MPIRDIAVLLAVFACAVGGLYRPWRGICGFAWVSYMNPHRFTWTFAYAYPVALIIAIPTLVGILLGRDRIRLPEGREVASCMLSLNRMKKYWHAKSDQWASGLCDALFVSFVAYMVGGVALGRVSFDLFYHLIAGVIILRGMMTPHLLSAYEKTGCFCSVWNLPARVLEMIFRLKEKYD